MKPMNKTDLTLHERTVVMLMRKKKNITWLSEQLGVSRPTMYKMLQDESNAEKIEKVWTREN